MKSRKIIYFIAIIGLIIVNSLYRYHHFLVLLIVLLGVGIVNYSVQKIIAGRGQLYAMFDNTRITLGEKLQAKVRYDSRFFVREPWARVEVSIRYSNETEEKVYNLNINKYSGRSDFSRGKIELLPMHCGTVYFKVKKLQIRDYINMFSTTLQYDFVRKACVFPELMTTATGDDEGTEQKEDSVTSLIKNDNDEIMDLRNYVEGDPMNRIHWNLSTLHDEYIVKLYGEQTENRVYVCADLSLYDSPNFRENLDKIYQWVYSITARIVERGGIVALMAWDENAGDIYYGDVKSAEDLYSCMEQLMDIRCSIDALVKLDKAFGKIDNSDLTTEPIVVTSSEYESDTYQMLNVSEDDLKEVLDSL